MESDIQKLIAARHYLHAHPELSSLEKNTTQFIHDFLEAETSAVIHRLKHTGVLAIFPSAQGGPSVLIRADIDALPIQEANNLPYRSIVDHVSHKCGHDGHTAILLGLALRISSQPLSNVQIVLLFQPAEETGTGAIQVIRDPIFEGLNFDFVFALHNLPGFPKNTILIKEGVFTPYVKSLIIRLQGVTAHAAEPENGQNPAASIGKIVNYIPSLSQPNREHQDFFLITPVYILLGSPAYGVSPGTGEIHFTLRAWEKNIMDKQCNRLIQTLDEICEQEQITYSLEWLQEFWPNNNDPTACEIIRISANKLKLNWQPLEHSLTWGEDFGVITHRNKGAMFGLGSGIETPPLHNPAYDFPDDILSSGINLFYQICQEVSSENS